VAAVHPSPSSLRSSSRQSPWLPVHPSPSSLRSSSR
jgi:hypothetical protein